MSSTRVHISVADEIFVSWRIKAGDPRRIVGRYFRNGNRVHFQYLLDEDFLKAINEGFSGITEFPDFSQTYEDVLFIISNRLIDKDRSDRVDYLKFWSAENDRYDEFDLVALTQAWLTNDKLEFLARFNVSENLVFVSDLAGQSHLHVGFDDLVGEEELSYQLVELEGYAFPSVEIRNSRGKKIGALKRVHCQTIPVALEMGLVPKIILKDQERNGVLKKIFVEVSFKLP